EKDLPVWDAFVGANNVLEGADDAAHRVQHAHRPLHHVGDLLPAHVRAQVVRFDVQDVYLTRAKLITGFSGFNLERRFDRTRDHLDQGGFATARFAGDSVDLVVL